MTSTDHQKLITQLHTGNYSCVIANGEVVRTFRRRGVIDIFELLLHDTDFLNGAHIADKVVGKAAAALMILRKVKYLYADILSQPALDLFLNYSFTVDYKQLVPHIINRTQTDLCPLEKLCSNKTTPQDCYQQISVFLRQLNTIESK